jgi:hypothetical protein
MMHIAPHTKRTSKSCPHSDHYDPSRGYDPREWHLDGVFVGKTIIDLTTGDIMTSDPIIINDDTTTADFVEEGMEGEESEEEDGQDGWDVESILSSEMDALHVDVDAEEYSGSM